MLRQREAMYGFRYITGFNVSFAECLANKRINKQDACKI